MAVAAVGSLCNSINVWRVSKERGLSAAGQVALGESSEGGAGVAAEKFTSLTGNLART
jgi:hypothetical protein